MESEESEIVKKKISEKSSFLFELRESGKAHIWNWTLLTSFLVTISLIILVFFSKDFKSFNNNVFKSSSDMVGIAISALGIILAAVAVTVVLYSRRSLHLLVQAEGIMSGLLFPYRYLSLLWAVIGILSFFSTLVQIKIPTLICTIMNVLYCFLIIYATIYFMYIISEIVQHVITSAFVENADSEFDKNSKKDE